MKRWLARIGRPLGLLLFLTAMLSAASFDPEDMPISDVGRAYQVPYRLTNTNHFLVRVRINGKGPFNFLVDTGAPALYVSTETARKIGLKPSEEDFWTAVDRLEFEGGATLERVKARVEDPFQLIGMNALGLPGASIDGILGFTMLARYRLELDPTKDRMIWTRLDYDPKEPPVPSRKPGQQAPEMQAMNALGPIAKFAAALIGKQPEDELSTRGFLGVELDAKPEKDKLGARITRVLPGSPASKAGLKEGDFITRIEDRDLVDVVSARAAVRKVKPGSRVRMVVQREGESSELKLTVTAGEGF